VSNTCLESPDSRLWGRSTIDRTSGVLPPIFTFLIGKVEGGVGKGGGEELILQLWLMKDYINSIG